MKIRYWLLIIIILSAGMINAAQVKRLSRKGYNILVLHSYNSTYVWSEDITRGIREQFARETDEKVNLYLEYLDAKRYPGSDYLDKMYIIIKEKYQDLSDFDLLLACDNQALTFMMKYGDSIFPGLPVVFCGINYIEHYDLSEYENFTGASETIRPDLTVEAMFSLQPDVKNLLVVSDCNTKTGIAAIKQARKLLSPYQQKLHIEYPMNYTMTQLEERLQLLDDKWAVLLLIFNLDRDGDFFEVEETAERISQASKAPVYACWDFYLGNGITGGALTSGYSQGESAARIAWKIIQGQKPQELPVFDDHQIKYIYDYNLLEKFGLNISDLDVDTEIINQKYNYFKENWKALLIFLGIIIFLSIYIIALLRTQRRLRNSRQRLHRKDQEWNKLAGSLPGLVFRMDTGMKFLYINSYFEDLLKQKPEEIIGKELKDLKLSKNIIIVNRRAVEQAVRTGKMQKVEFKYGTGMDIRAFETTIQPEIEENGEINSLLGIVYDLTDRYKTEMKLKNSEMHATEARRIAKLGYWELDVMEMQISWSKEMSKILGIEHAPENQTIELLSNSVGSTSQQLVKSLNHRIITGELEFDHSYSLINAQGMQKHLHERGEIIIDSHGNAVSVYGTVQDITSEKQAEQQIRSSEEKFRAIFNHAPLGISLINSDLNLVYHNSTLVSLCGYSTKEMENMNVSRLMHIEDKNKCLKQYKKLFNREQERFNLKKRLLTKSGKTIWTLTTVTSFYIEEEDKLFALTMELDINNQVIAENLAEERQQLLKSAQQIAKFGYWRYDPNRDLINCSEEMAVLLGYNVKNNLHIPREEFISYMTEPNREKFMEQLHHCVVIESQFELAVQLTNRKQEVLQANIRMVSQKNHTGSNDVLGTFIDITVMKSIETQLKQVEARFKLFFQNSPLGIVIIDQNLSINLINPALLHILNLKKEDIINERFSKYIISKHRADFIRIINDINNGSIPSLVAEYQLLNNAEEPFWCSFTIAQLDSGSTASKGIMILVDDINDRKIAREKLIESEAKYRSVFEVSRDGLFLTNADNNNILEVNSSGAEMFGYQKNDLINNTILTLASDKKNMNLLIAQRNQMILNEWGLKKNGDKFPMEISLNYFQRNNINYHVAAVRNISERLQFQAELKESEKKFRTIVENAPMGIIFVNELHGVIFSNHVVYELLKIDQKQAPQQLENLLLIDQKDIYKMILEDIFKGERDTYFDETKMTRHDNSTFWGRINISVVHTEQGKPDFAIIMIQDITEQREVEDKLHLYEKLESIGQLAGMIAHDFNNQLMGVLGYATILQEQLIDDKMREYAQMIYNSAEKSASLTQKLLSFARKGRHITINQDFHKLIKETLSLVQTTIQTKIKVNLHLNAKLSIVALDPGQVQNALLNLVLNACDAMPDGGNLYISSKIIELTEEDSSSFFEKIIPGRYIKVTIRDTGQGMDDHTQKHLFEPFFTTKQEGKGTGLGLPAVFGTIKSHQGYIRFESEINKGTSFDIFFPLAEIQVEDNTGSSKTVYSIHGSGNIILIDDEEIVRKTVKTLLESLGYNVDTFERGSSALKHYKDNWEEIDLILLDVIMPEMDGPQVFVELQKINPKVKVLLFSAYSATRNVQQTLDNGALGFIHKPILRDELSQKISQALADQKVNNITSLFGIKEAKRIDINQNMINDLKKGFTEQFTFILEQIKISLSKEETDNASKMIIALEMFTKRAKIKNLSQYIKELKKLVNTDIDKCPEVLDKITETFLDEIR